MTQIIVSDKALLHDLTRNYEVLQEDSESDDELILLQKYQKALDKQNEEEVLAVNSGSVNLMTNQIEEPQIQYNFSPYQNRNASPIVPNQSFRKKSKSKRPISAYTVGTASTGYSFKQLPSMQVKLAPQYQLNLEDRLFQERLALKQQKKDATRENQLLKIQIRSYENEFKKKDELIKRLYEEIKRSPAPMSTEARLLSDVKKRCSNCPDAKHIIKSLKADLVVKESELLSAQRQLRFVKIQELENRIEQYQYEVNNLLARLEEEKKLKPALKAKEIRAFEDTIKKLQQQCQYHADQTALKTQQNQDLLNKIDQLKQKLIRVRYKTRRLNIVNKSLMQRIKQCSNKDEIQQRNQILTQRLTQLGVDVEKIFAQQASGKSVKFTFVGPAGLIEGGSNQSFALPIEAESIQNVQQIKNLLVQELEMDQGIDLILKNKAGKIIQNVKQLKQACSQGQVIVEFVEVDVENTEEENYSQGAFEVEDQKPAQAAVTKLRERVKLENVRQQFEEIRLILMIKKVPFTHIVRYLVQDGDQISCSNVKNQIEAKFQYIGDCINLARYLTDPDGAEIKDTDHVISRGAVVARIKQVISPYDILNGMQLTKILSQIQEIGEKFDQRDFMEDLGLEDQDNLGVLPFEKIQRVWKMDKLPKIDDKMWEFLKIIALGSSKSLCETNYKDFMDVFQQDYQINQSNHQDYQSFNHEDFEPDQDDRNLPQQQSENNDDEFAQLFDEVLGKIAHKLPQTNRKSELFCLFAPYMQSLQQEDGSNLLFVQADHLLEILEQSLNINLEQQEKNVLLQVLGAQVDNEQRIILFQDFYNLTKNYSAKQRLMEESVRLGIEYRVMNKPTLQFILDLKDHLVIQDLPWKNFEVQQSNVQIMAMELSQFFDFIVMKYGIRMPKQQEPFMWLTCIPDHVVKSKLERVLNDVEILYVDLMRIAKNEDQYKKIHLAQQMKWKKTQQQIKFQKEVAHKKHREDKKVIQKVQQQDSDEENYEDEFQGEQVIEDYYGDSK